MPKEIVIDIAPDGEATGMHFDQFDLGFLGDKDIQRASDIVWNKQSKWWEIIVAGQTEPVGHAACGFASYEEAREFEVKWFQECRKRREHPHSAGGNRIAAGLRVA
jgi:hypothetical protein